MSTAVADAPIDQNESPFMTVPQLMRYLSLSKTGAYDLLKKANLPTYPVGANGGAYRILRSDLQNYLQSVVRTSPTDTPAASPPPRRRLQELKPRRRGERTGKRG